MIAFNITQDPRSYGTYKPKKIWLHLVDDFSKLALDFSNKYI